MRLLLAVFTIVTLLCAPSLGQTTQPAPSTWTESAARVVEALISPSGDASAIGRLIPDGATVQRFGSREADSHYRLQQQTQAMSVVSVRGYTWPAPTIASDLAADIKESQSLPESVQKQFEIKDETDARRANTTAAQWVASVLGPSTGESVAVVVLWPPQPPAIASIGEETAAPDQRQPFFILIKAQPRDGAFRITQIAYGDVSAALK